MCSQLSTSSRCGTDYTCPAGTTCGGGALQVALDFFRGISENAAKMCIPEAQSCTSGYYWEP
jgi:hypothetical protein